MAQPKHLFFLMNHFFYGFGASFALGATGFGIVWFSLSEAAAYQFLNGYIIDFNCLVSGGLVIGNFILVYKTQSTITDIIEKNIDINSFKNEYYNEHKRRLFSASRSVSFSSIFIFVSFWIFYLSVFPYDKLSQLFMIGFGCMHYAMGVYVGRKEFYIAQILYSIEDVVIEESVFRHDKLNGIVTYVNSLSIITSIVTYVHVLSYLSGPFEYSSSFGEMTSIFLYLPAIIATPVIILFNFYPKTVLRKIYNRSIHSQLDAVKERLEDADVSYSEKLMCMIEYDRLAKEELNTRMRVTLSDITVLVPIGISVLALIFG